MKALLWKEYRQNRKVLGAVGIFVLLPYVIVLIVGVVVRARNQEDYDHFVPFRWSELLMHGSLWSSLVLMFACAFITGHAIAGERADRSAEFAAYLPISRRSAIGSKAILAIGACLLIALFNGLIAYSASGANLVWITRNVGDGIAFGAATAVLIFGVSWFVSTLVSTPAIATASGLGAAIALVCTVGLSFEILGLPASDLWYLLPCLILGTACFVGGTVYYVRRVEP